MTPSRVVRALSLFLSLAAFPTITSAATTEFRVLFDTDSNAATGCTIAGMAGVEQVLVTEVVSDDSTPRVNRTYRQLCTGTALGALTDIVTTGWPAVFGGADRVLTLETRTPFASFGSTGIPSNIHVGFDVRRDSNTHAALVNADGSPIVLPAPPPGRRRAVADGPDRVITLDGALPDWVNITPIMTAAGRSGAPALRLLRVLSFANSVDDNVYLAARVRLDTNAPFADDDHYLRQPGENLSVAAPGVLLNDSDPLSRPLSASKVTDAARGTVILNADGSFTYSPDNPASNIADEFEYKALAGTSESNVARVLIRVDVDQSNVPADDAYTTKEDINLNVAPPGVLANDPPENLLASLVSGPAHGTVVVNANGGFTYNPDTNFFGTDTFVYLATRQANGTPAGTATVTITVESVNDAPKVQSATFNVPEHAPNGTLVGVVQASDPDAGDDLTFSILSGNTGNAFAINPSTGAITVANSGAINFAVQPTYSLQVRARDDGDPAKSDTATITINIINENDAPIAANDGYSTGEGVPLAVPAPGVLGNDSDPDGDDIDVVSVVGPANGVLNIDPETGGFTYTPNGGFAGLDTFTYRASDGSLSSPAATVTITVTRVPAFTSANTTTFTAGVASSFTVTTTGYPPPNITVTGALPAGITFADDGPGFPTGTLGGTAQAGTGGVYNLTFTATNVAGSTPQSFTLVICNQIAVINPANSSGPAGSPFSATFTQTGAVGTATFTTSSTLPTGLTLATNGVLSGTPTQGGTFPIVVTVTDANGCTGTGATYNLIITCPTITVNNPANANGTANSAFSETFTQTGGTGAATFALASGTLPAGLTLATNGTLSGTPTQTGSFPITVTATDSNGCTGTGSTYTIVIGCQTITVNNPANANGTANSAFSETFTQTGAIGATTFSLGSGTLPAGLTLAANGVLSGTPTQTGSFPITVTATDSNGCTGTSATYTIVIACQTITVTNPANANGAVSSPFSETFTAPAAIGATSFTLESGTLPAGLTLSTAGVLSGTPTVDGSFPITVRATDANSCTGVGGTYTIVIGCQTITVTNPATTTGTVNAAFSQTFTQSGAVGGATFTTASTLPAGLTLATNGTLSGTPTQDGSFPIVVTVTDGNGCTGTSATYNLVIACQTITVTNPSNATGAAGSPFSESFGQTGAVGGATFTTASTLPTGMTLSAAGILSGTPTQGGSFPIVVTVTDGNGCTGTGSTYTLVITCPTITVTNPGNGNGTANSAFSELFSASGGVGTYDFTLASGTLPTGLTLAANGTLSGTPTQTGVFNITVTATDDNGCTGTGTQYTITIACQTITVTNPANANGTASSAFSETFGQTGGIGTTTFSIASGTLPAGLTLAANGVLSGTPTQTGSFPITVTATDSNGCTGTGSTYTIVIACQTVTVNNPANANGTVNAAFSETFTAPSANGATTFTLESGTLPAGLTLSTAGVLSGTPTVDGSFPITVRATDANSCTGVGGTYTIVIGCQTITVTNPATTTGTVNAAFSQTFTQSGAVGGATFTTASTLPAGLTLATNGTLSGTPTQDGSFPIVVTVTDGNGCTGTSATYNLVIACQTITVTNPSNATGAAGSPFSESFGQTGAVGGATFTTASTLPTGMTLSAAGILSGTPTQGGSFPIVVTVTDGNGCTGTGSTYTLVITCPTITVTNPGNGNGTANSAFSELFSASGGVGTYDFTLASGTLPTGLTLAANGTLSGTPTQTGVFNITVTATDDNGCTGTGTQYTITIACQTITVTNPANANGTASSAFSETFGQTGGIGTTTFSIASGTLPAGLTLASNGLLSGTPTQTGSFPITVTATDSNGCTGTGGTYTINIACQTVTVTNPANGNGTVNAAFSETFTAPNANGTTSFTLATGSLPAGLTLASNGVLSGTPTVDGSFPITVTATDANGCTGTGGTYTIVIACQTITVTNPATTTGTVNAAFSQTFTQSGAVGGATFTTASTLPAGLTLATNGTLSGTPTQGGSFPIVVTVTDGNGCTGTSATYNLTISCQTITVTNPVNTSGTAGTSFTETFGQTGAVGTATFTTASTLPAGLVLQTDGTLTGTPTGAGNFDIVVTVTDSNGCTGTGATYSLVIGCQTIAATNPTPTTIAAGTAAGATYTFTATGILGTANWTVVTGSLPAGITLNATSGQLEGSSTVQGSYPVTVRVTDTNGCFDETDYTLDVTCPTITVTRNGGGTFPNGTFNTVYSGQSITASGGTGPYTFQVTAGALPTGLSLASDGTISGTATHTGTFNFTVTATDAALCTGSQAFSIAIAPSAGGDSFSNLVNNTQAVVTGGTTTSPSTPFVPLTGAIVANDSPSGGVSVVAGTFATTQGGSVTIAADGTFIYTPPVTVNALATDTFNYTIASDTGSTGTPVQAVGTVTLNLAGRVWYVKNDGANGNGQSQSPFNSTSNFVNGARSGPDKPGDIIYIYRGDGTTTNLATGVVLLDNEQLIGEGVALVVNTHTLVGAGLAPQLTLAAGTVIELGNGNTVRGLTATGGANGISGTSKTGFTGGTLTLQNNSGSGITLTTFAGTVTLTGTTITNNGVGVTLNGGNPTVTIDATNTITANAAQRSINFLNLGATAVVGIGAGITDNGLGISVTNSASGAAISFTGSQTLSTTVNNAVTLSTNTGATITFSGTLGITTTTGSGFSATGGGILNVGAGASTASVTTGAAGTASVNITGMTVGAGGVTFDAVNATGPVTGINLVNNNGTVAVNGGTINNAGTGAHMQGATTSLSLAGVTIGGTTTTGIASTTNFGTLTIGASVTVSAATALNLTAGAVSGTFASVTSTGGTNGVSLTGITGTWGATAGALSGATGATFNVSGGSGSITWGPTISQANAGNVVTIAGSNSAVINFNANVTSSGTSTGLSISGSSGTYNFNGAANAFSGAGGIVIGPSQSGTIVFSNGTSITATGTAFNVAGGAGAVTATITYGGTINKNSPNGLVVVDNLDSPGTLSMTHTPAAAGNLTQNSATAAGISVINSTSTNITIANASVTFTNTAAGFTGSGNGGTINLPGLALTGNGNKPGMLISGGGTINVNAGAANPSINLSAGNNAASKAIDGTTASFTGTLNLTNVTITGNATASADIVTLTGSTLGGTGSSISGANRALVLSGVTLTTGAGMTSVTSSGGASGISLTNVTGGTSPSPYVIAGGALSANSGSTFFVSGGSAFFTYNGTMSQSNAQRVVNISGITGGTLLLGGAITGSASCTGITAGGSGGTVTFSGGMALDGGSDTFTASTGITINVTGTNTIGATTVVTAGPAVNITATIGTSGVTFRSVSVNGGANGVVLSNTGTGTFSITGNSGGNCGGIASPGSVSGTSPDTADCTGGWIRSTSGSGFLLTNVQNVSLTRVRVSGHAGFGLHGTTVDGFVLNSSYFHNNGDSNAGDGEGNVYFYGLTGGSGENSITNCYLDLGANRNLHVLNTSGTLDRLTVTGTTIGNDGTNGSDGIFIQADNSANTAVAVTVKATVTGGRFLGSRGDGIQFSARGTSVNDFVFTGNRMRNNHPNVLPSNFAVTLSSGGSAGSYNPTVTFDISSNNISEVGSTGISVGKGGVGGGTFTGTITQNVIGDAAVANSGSAQGSCIVVDIVGGGLVDVDILNNTLRQFTNYGILAQAGNAAAGGGTGKLVLDIRANNIATPSPASAAALFPTSGIRVMSGTNAGDNHTVCATIGGTLAADKNTVNGTGTNGGADLRLFQRFLTIMAVPGYGGLANNNPQMETFLTGRNNLTTVSASNNTAAGGPGWSSTCP
jgi:hypothetical protein